MPAAQHSALDVARAVSIGSDLVVDRNGYGAMRPGCTDFGAVGNRGGVDDAVGLRELLLGRAVVATPPGRRRSRTFLHGTARP